MRRSARLRSVMSRSTKMWPWKRRVLARDRGCVTDTGIVWPRAVLHDRLAGLGEQTLPGRTPRGARSAISDGELDVPRSCPGSYPSSCSAAAIRGAHAAVRRRDQHGVAHAVQQDVEVVAGDRRAGERLAHPLERASSSAAISRTPLRRDRLGVVSAADQLRAVHQRADRAVDARDERATPSSPPAASAAMPGRSAGAIRPEWHLQAADRASAA